MWIYMQVWSVLCSPLLSTAVGGIVRCSWWRHPHHLVLSPTLPTGRDVAAFDGEDQDTPLLLGSSDNRWSNQIGRPKNWRRRVTGEQGNWPDSGRKPAGYMRNHSSVRCVVFFLMFVRVKEYTSVSNVRKEELWFALQNVVACRSCKIMMSSRRHRGSTKLTAKVRCHGQWMSNPCTNALGNNGKLLTPWKPKIPVKHQIFCGRLIKGSLLMRDDW